MDIRYLAWGGYDFAPTSEAAGVCAPEFTSEDVGEKRMKGQKTAGKVNLRGSSVKPTLVAYPRPTQ